MPYSIAYYVEHAIVQRERGHSALESSRKDRLAIARRYFREALMAMKEAKRERDSAKQ
jgi:hypothetical protein